MAGQFYGTCTPPSTKANSTPVRKGSIAKSTGISSRLPSRPLQPTTLNSQSTAACDESSSLAEVIRINQVQDKELRALRTMVEDQNTKIASLTITVEDIWGEKNRIAPRTQENNRKV